jgi:hypothetical protein
MKTTQNPRITRRSGRIMAGLLALTLMLLTGCDLEFPEQEVILLHDTKADRLDFLLVYRGVTASSDDRRDVADAVSAATRILGGRREFMLLDWPLHWDLDGKDKDVPQWLRKNVKLERVDTFVDAKGRLCAYQLFTMSKVSEGLRLLNEAIAASILEAHQKGKLEKGVDVLGLVELYGFLDQAAAGLPFLRLEKGRLMVDVPMPSQETIRRLVEESRKNDTWALSNLLALTRNPRIGTQGQLTIQLGDHRNGMTVLGLRRPDVRYRTGLHEALVAAALVAH